jgi:hypothetical protein
VAFRFIAANDHPDHDTIAAFRRRFLKEIDGMSIPDELARREERLRKIAEARAKIEARAKERHAREMAEHEAKFAAREAKTAATGKKPGGKPSGEALRAPALDPVSRWRVEEVRDLARQFTPVEQRVGAVYVREKLESVTRASHPLAAGMPGSLIIVGGGAAGNAAAETLRHEGYFGRITMLSADESMPCDRPNLSKGYLAGTASEESNLLRSAKFYREHEWRK